LDPPSQLSYDPLETYIRKTLEFGHVAVAGRNTSYFFVAVAYLSGVRFNHLSSTIRQNDYHLYTMTDHCIEDPIFSRFLLLPKWIDMDLGFRFEYGLRKCVPDLVQCVWVPLKPLQKPCIRTPCGGNSYLISHFPHWCTSRPTVRCSKETDRESDWRNVFKPCTLDCWWSIERSFYDDPTETVDNKGNWPFIVVINFALIGNVRQQAFGVLNDSALWPRPETINIRIVTPRKYSHVRDYPREQISWPKSARNGDVLQMASILAGSVEAVRVLIISWLRSISAARGAVPRRLWTALLGLRSPGLVRMAEQAMNEDDAGQIVDNGQPWVLPKVGQYSEHRPCRCLSMRGNLTYSAVVSVPSRGAWTSVRPWRAIIL